MRLLVSVRDAEEAAAALSGGADVVDAKDPASGALGAVSLDVLQQIATAINGARPVTAALGDAIDETSIGHATQRFTAAGAGLVKIGFAGISSRHRVAALLAAARRETTRNAGIIAVAYADANRVASLTPDLILDAAVQAGAAGVLLDTADKSGPRLCEILTPAGLQSWVATAHAAGLLVALAGRLTADDLLFVRDVGADIAGVRGAACDGGRLGRVTATKVAVLRERARQTWLSSLRTRTCA
jgi:uncharacterized protein (UPF0264 family)